MEAIDHVLLSTHTGACKHLHRRSFVRCLRLKSMYWKLCCFVEITKKTHDKNVKRSQCATIILAMQLQYISILLIMKMKRQKNLHAHAHKCTWIGRALRLLLVYVWQDKNGTARSFYCTCNKNEIIAFRWIQTIGIITKIVCISIV